ncbi:MarR family transcriptional regulator [Deinococcus sp. KNUC1210]|uniref:helix-turn-helix transcriptional regulator n=1 Tax=Deinococcus sp. KNUC1210 TaxID=2917691 RepID=UPI001EEFD518|nr:helix-turn-helix domain-containing protein [Deinococcus sp. KNUC1210]ULH16607.1 MarR family transcriptional regulator [Deinococcus sp. KNUC1210]
MAASGSPARFPVSASAAPQIPSAPQGPLPANTKSRLLEVVKRHGAQTAQALARELEISVPAARKHLQGLQEAGLIAARTEKPGGRGRPQHVYALSERGESTFPKSYATLCSDVLSHVQQLFGEGAVLQVMDARRAELYRRLSSVVQGDLDQRVQILAHELKEAGYAAEVIYERGAWFLVERNCPALKVARDFGQLCESELNLYRDLLGTNVVRESRIACGAAECRYRIG